MKHRAPFALRMIALSFLPIFILFSETSHGQAASAVWALTSNANAVVTGNVTATAANATGSVVVGFPTFNSCGAYSHNWSLNSTGSDATRYVQFSISPAAGYSLTAMTFKEHSFGTSSSGTCCSIGGVDEVAYYSVNGGSYTLFAGQESISDNMGDDGDCTLGTRISHSLNGGTGVNVPAGGTLTIRLYGFAFNVNTDRLYIGNVEIDGTTTPTCTAPTITSFSPTSACSGSGSVITINGSNFVSGTTTVTINGVSATPVTFVNSGQITVPLPAGATGTGNIVVTTATGCTVTSASTFTVNTAPATPGAITGNTSICSNSSNTYSVTAVGGAATYTWSLPATWTGTSTTNSISTTAGTSSGTVSVTANNTCGNSSPATLAVNVTTAAPATPGAISGNTSICANSGNTYSITPVGGATSYTWSLPGGWTGTSTTNSITTTANAAGGTVSVTANNICGSSAPATLVVTINTAPATPGTISGNATICSGGLDTFSVAAGGGATSYTWSLPGGWTGTSTTNTINTVAGSGGGTVSVTANNTCGNSSPATLAITVNSVPVTPGAITGRTSICSGGLDTFSATAVGGATSYTWSLPGGWTGTSTTNTINTVAGSGGGTVSVTANNTCGNSSPATLAVTINTAPATPGAITGRASICSGGLDTFSIASVGGATSYTWSLPGGWTGTSTTNTINTVAGSSGGTVSVSANNTCGNSSPATLAVTINTAPATPGAITGTAGVCSGGLDTFSVAAVGGATSYTWSLPGGWTGTSTTNAINTVAGSSGGTVSVTANNTCGSSSPASLVVTFGSAPAAPGAITGRSTICSAGLDTFSVASVGGATSYTWSLPGGWTGTSTTNTIFTTAGSGGGTVSVTANNACGGSTPATMVITVNSAPATPGAITGRTPVCSGSLDTFSIASIGGATSYTWSLPGGWTGTSTTNTINTTAGSGGGTVSVTANNTCGISAPATLAVTVNITPATPGVISGQTVVCSGGADTFSVAPVGGATSYTWSLPGGWTGTSSTNTINTVAGSSGGTVSVTANSVCGNSAPATLPVTISSVLATPGAITGRTPACTGSQDTFSVATVSGATTYNWSLPGGWTGTSTTNVIVATVGSTGGTVSVTAGNSCSTSTPATLPVTTGTVPATPGTISGTATFCSGNLDTFSIASVNGATSYTWTLPNGWTGTSSTTIIHTTAGTAGGNVSVTANNGCGSSSAATLVVTPNSSPPMPGVIFGRATECLGALDTFAIQAVTGATSYTWTLPNGWTTTGSTINAITGNAGTSGTVSVTANNVCGSSAAQIFTVVVTSPPATPGTITGRTSVCSGTLDTFSVAAVNGATTYTWSLPNGWTGTSITNTIITTAGSAGGTVSVTAGNSCGTSSAQTLAVSVTTVPALPGAISGTATLCSGALDTFSVAPVNGATSYTWTLPNGWTGTSTTNVINTTAGTSGGIVTVKANNSCGSSGAQSFTTVISTGPPTPGTITSRASGCTTGNADTFSVAPVNGATSYTWTLPNGWTGTSTTNSIISTIGASGGNVTVKANNACGSSAAQILAVTVGSAPAMPGNISGRATICSVGGLDTFTVAPVSGATSYIWTLPSGWTGTSTTNTIIATTGSAGGVITVAATNSCGTSGAQSFTTVVSSAPATPGTINRSSGCSMGSVDTFSVPAVNGATSYTWTLPNGWSGTSTTNTIITVVGANGGTVSVTANNACGRSVASTLSVTVGSGLAAPGPITGTSVVCSGGIDTFYIAPVAGATSYTWTLPNGWTGASVTNIIYVTIGTSSGNVSVFARNSCGISTTTSLFVNITAQAPSTPGFINGPVDVCRGDQDTFYVTRVNGVSYIWTLPNTWTGSSSTNSIIATIGAHGGMITVAAQNGCGTSSIQYQLDTLNLPPQVVFDYSKNPVCLSHNAPVTLNMGVPYGGTYSGPGVNGTLFDPSTLSPGNYVLTYFYRDPVGCWATDTANFAVDACTGIETTEEGQIAVYPNPFTDAVTITTNGSNGSGKAILVDAAGREVRRIDFNGGETSIQVNTSSLSAGIYVLSISVEGKLVTVRKLVRTE